MRRKIISNNPNKQCPCFGINPSPFNWGLLEMLPLTPRWHTAIWWSGACGLAFTLWCCLCLDICFSPFPAGFPDSCPNSGARSTQAQVFAKYCRRQKCLWFSPVLPSNDASCLRFPLFWMKSWIPLTKLTSLFLSQIPLICIKVTV